MMRGKWAQGLEPRMFTWIVRDRLAGSERPGGYARNHRKVRRLEELIWLARNGFTHVVSLLASTHNLKAYEEAQIPATQVPLARASSELAESLVEVYGVLGGLLDDPAACVLVHEEEFGDRLAGVLAGYLLYAGLIDSPPQAITVVEQLIGWQMGPPGRELVVLTHGEGIRRARP